MSDERRLAASESPGLNDGLSRRHMLQSAAGLAAASAVGFGASGCAREQTGTVAAVQRRGRGVRRGRIKQSVVQWCFSEHWELEETCQIANELNVPSVELLGTNQLPVAAEHGIICAITSIDMSPDPFPFINGFNNPANHDRLVEETRRCIDAAAEYDSPNVIGFTGFKYHDPENPEAGEFTRQECLENSIEGFKKVIPYAEEKGITICLEHLNTRDDSHPMKGHPGYQGDDLDLCLEICKGVDSPRMKLLFDIYHVQIMHGDVIRRLRECDGYLGHIHTAGNPGRHELDDTQELQYAPIMRALLDLGYEGYVGQEFLPTRDPRQGLTEAVELCDV